VKYTKQQQEEVKHFLEFLDIRTGIKNLEFSNADVITDMQEEIERLNNIISELEKDMIERYHKEIDYQSKIMQSDLMHGDYPVSYYYAEQNEKLLNYYLNILKELKGADKK